MLAETQVLNHLDSFVGSVEKWLAAKVAERTGEQQARKAAVDRQKPALAVMDRHRDLLLADYRRQVTEGRSTAYLVLEEVERIDREREAQQQAVAEAEAVLGEWLSPPDVDAALDFYNELADLVQGRIRKAD